MKKNKWQIWLIGGLVIVILVMVIILVRNSSESQEISEELSIDVTTNGNNVAIEPTENVIPAPPNTTQLTGQLTVSSELAQTSDIGTKPVAEKWQAGLGMWWFNRGDSGQELNCIDDVCRWRAKLTDGATYPAFFVNYETQKDDLVAIAENYLRNSWGFNKIMLMPDSEMFYSLGGETSSYYLSEVLDATRANVVSWAWYWEHNGQIMAWKNMPAARVALTTTGQVLNVTIMDRTPVSAMTETNTQALLNNTELMSLVETGAGEWLKPGGLLGVINRTEIRRQEIVWVSDEQNKSIPYYYLSGVFSDGEMEQKNTVVLK